MQPTSTVDTHTNAGAHTQGHSLQAQWTHMNAGAHTQGHILLYYIIAYHMQ